VLVFGLVGCPVVVTCMVRSLLGCCVNAAPPSFKTTLSPKSCKFLSRRGLMDLLLGACAVQLPDTQNLSHTIKWNLSFITAVPLVIPQKVAVATHPAASSSRLPVSFCAFWKLPKQVVGRISVEVSPVPC
jgi:hypothetical protein